MLVEIEVGNHLGLTIIMGKMNLGIKEKAVLGALGPAMNLIEGWTKNIKAENEVSKFVEQNMGILFEQQNPQVNPTLTLLTKLAIAEANDNPEYVLQKFLKFYEALRVWYPQYRDKQGMNSANP